jgi:hypothetical protein
MDTQQAPKGTEWWAGSNDEWLSQGPFKSRDEALSEGRNIWPDSHFFIGRSGTYTPFRRDFVEELLELEACDVNDACGPEASDNWPPATGITKEQREEANKKIAAILTEICGECTVFPILGCERIESINAAV